MAGGTLLPGDMLDGFTVDSIIDAGAMARVYRVTHPDYPDLPLLLKQPRLGGDDAEFLLGFETEAMIMPTLSGMHAPRFISAGDISDTPYIVMEWIEGTPLESERKRGRSNVDEVAWFGARVADALHALHQQQVVHHDLKPENILVRHEGLVTLLDYGLAHHAHLPDLLQEEQRHAAGSAPYVSPEQILGVRGDPRSDLFALGVILYELATGELPFEIPQSPAGLRTRLWKQPVPPCVHVPELPPWLQEVILRCLEPDAASRYQKAAHIAFDLRHPTSVAVSERGWRREPPSLTSQIGRWWRARQIEPERKRVPNLLSGEAPIILVAVDTRHMDDPRHVALLRNVSLMLASGPEYRLILTTVIAPDQSGGESAQLEHRVRLKHWAEPLKLPPERVTLHVLEDTDPANALVEFARRNLVDLIALGAPGPDEAPMAWWRSVASTVTSHAHCSVHVVRLPRILKG
jgi:eukaryotic-like serine/threonine-protein kinase